jgi:hypothetical protein
VPQHKESTWAFPHPSTAERVSRVVLQELADSYDPSITTIRRTARAVSVRNLAASLEPDSLIYHERLFTNQAMRKEALPTTPAF